MRALLALLWFVLVLSAPIDAQGRVRGLATTRGVGPSASSRFGIIFDGDSLTMDTTSGNVPFPTQVVKLIGRFNVAANTAVSGYTTADIIAHMATVVVPQFDAWTGRPKVYVLLIGTNDGFTHYSDVVTTICPAVVAAGAQMVILTGLPWNTESVEAQRQTYNTSIRNGTGGACPYAVADIAGDSRIGDLDDHLNVTYYRDGTHLTTAGAAIVASYVLTALQGLGVQ